MTEEKNCRIRVYQNGKLLGFWTNGGTNRLRIHAVLMTKARAQDVVGNLEISDRVKAEGYTFTIAED